MSLLFLIFPLSFTLHSCPIPGSVSTKAFSLEKAITYTRRVIKTEVYKAVNNLYRRLVNFPLPLLIIQISSGTMLTDGVSSCDTYQTLTQQMQAHSS